MLANHVMFELPQFKHYKFSEYFKDSDNKTDLLHLMLSLFMAIVKCYDPEGENQNLDVANRWMQLIFLTLTATKLSDFAKSTEFLQ